MENQTVRTLLNDYQYTIIGSAYTDKRLDLLNKMKHAEMIELLRSMYPAARIKDVVLFSRLNDLSTPFNDACKPAVYLGAANNYARDLLVRFFCDTYGQSHVLVQNNLTGAIERRSVGSASPIANSNSWGVSKPDLNDPVSVVSYAHKHWEFIILPEGSFLAPVEVTHHD